MKKKIAYIIFLDKQTADLMAVWNVWDHLASDVFYQSV